MFYTKEKTYLPGQEVLKVIKNGVQRAAMNHNKTSYSFKELIMKGKKLSTLYNWLEKYPMVR